MTTREMLRSLPVLAHQMPSFDPAAAPAEPAALFADWLAEAVAAGVDEPHAMTLSTADPAVSRQDFLARPEGSRIATLAGRQSAVLTDRAELDRELADIRARLAADPGLVAEAHTVYAVAPVSVEFWQADRDRRHVRLRYRRTEGGWEREQLWP